MSIKLDELSNSCKSKMLCRFCHGTGINNWEEHKNITLYGLTMKEILNIIDFAKCKGYKKDNE